MYGYGLFLNKDTFYQIKNELDEDEYLIKDTSTDEKIYLILDKKPSVNLLNKLNVDENDVISDFYFKYFVKELSEKELSITSAESLTGGLFQSSLTEIPGVSKVFFGGIVSYSNEIKNKLLKVPQSVINQDGVVSENTVYFMAKGSKELFDSDIAISFSGVAGPDKLENKYPGTVWIGIIDQNNHFFKLELALDDNLSRNEIRNESVFYGIKKLVEII
ncbi:nicotinamide-nucleotide amidohydrolase family protein [Lactobacillus sp. S2-2]|uniref:CinA family protein n=1 Tax=Lactobacillus sp. S2-2 TaxID=2692917 RepID=UPI001F15979E|nr:CinA family protein [Lactobacillus sp. S2-2]MCF6515799.1 nicotinamide-nucleotide amidohydrolase family protein [Lactobacillus sp. S2-2]